MTLEHFFAHGIQIEGKVIVKRWNDDTEDYDILIETEFIRDYCNKVTQSNIKYMYVTDNALHIEVE